MRNGRELDAHAGIARDEIAERAREVVGRKAVRRANAHVAGEHDVDVGNFRLRVQERALHFLRRGKKTLAALVSRAPVVRRSNSRAPSAGF